MPNLKYPVVDGRKQCGMCGAWKPLDDYKRARKHYASGCESCRKAWAAKYRQRPEVKAKMLAYSREYRAVEENRLRLNERSRLHKLSPRTRARNNALRRAWAASEKQKAVAYKGGHCVCCGYSGCLAAMDFHHRDPSQKEGYGTGALKSHWTFERNKPEIDKCELVCVRCHREIHAGARVL